MVDSSDHMRDHKCDHDDERYSEQPKNDWHWLPPMIFTNDLEAARFPQNIPGVRGTAAIRTGKSLARAATRLFTPSVDPRALP
jgi:hypothetical protein